MSAPLGLLAVHFTYGASILTSATVIDRDGWITKRREIPVNEHTAMDVILFRVENHDIPDTDITMKNARLVSGLVGCIERVKLTWPRCDYSATHRVMKHAPPLALPGCSRNFAASGQ